MLRPQNQRRPNAKSRTRSNRVRSMAEGLCAFGVLTFAVVFANGAEARSDSTRDELRSWTPSVALEVGIYGHTGKGNIDSTEISGPRIVPPVPLRSGDFPSIEDPNNPGSFIDVITRPLASREEISNAVAGVNFELMSPAITTAGPAPRFFWDLSISDPMGSEVRLAIDADPSELSISDDAADNFPVGEAALLGRGHNISVQSQGPQIHTGFGVAYTINWGAETIRIKPSLVYSRVKQIVTVTSRRGIRLSNTQRINNPLDNPADYRFFNFDDQVDEVYHGIGPALELEYDTGGRVGPFDFTIFIKGHASRFFGDVTTELQATNPEYQAEQIFYKYSQDRWVFRGTTGFRFRLNPQERRRR